MPIREAFVLLLQSPDLSATCRVNNCVGYYNYKYFILFLFYTVLLCAWFCLSGLYDFIRAWVRISPAWRQSLSLVCKMYKKWKYRTTSLHSYTYIERVLSTHSLTYLPTLPHLYSAHAAKCPPRQSSGQVPGNILLLHFRHVRILDVSSVGIPYLPGLLE